MATLEMIAWNEANAIRGGEVEWGSVGVGRGKDRAHALDREERNAKGRKKNGNHSRVREK
jgi:hypothetical protein